MNSHVAAIVVACDKHAARLRRHMFLDFCLCFSQAGFFLINSLNAFSADSWLRWFCGLAAAASLLWVWQSVRSFRRARRSRATVRGMRQTIMQADAANNPSAALLHLDQFDAHLKSLDK